MVLFSIQAQFYVMFVKIELRDKETCSASPRPPARLGERCSSGRKLCHLLTSFFSPLSTNRILQRKGERGTARERQRGRRERRRMRGVFVLPCCEPESDLSSKIKTCRAQHLLDPLTRKHTYFLAFTQSTNISSVSVPSMKSRIFLLHPPSPSDLCPFPSITPSRTLNHHPHPSLLPLLSIHPSFLLSPPIPPSISWYSRSVLTRAWP